MGREDMRNPVHCFSGKNPLLLVLSVIIWIYSLGIGRAEIFERISKLNSSHTAPTTANGYSGQPSLSPDGQIVLFTSAADNLSLTTNGATLRFKPDVLNVFTLTRTNSLLNLISVDFNGTNAGNGNSLPCGMSADGRTVLFESKATNLLPNDTNGFTDIFVRDFEAMTTRLVSVGLDGNAANGSSRSAVITPNGRFVAFVSEASNLVEGDTNGIADVFVRDLELESTSIATEGSRTSGPSPGRSEVPRMSFDGRYIAFQSRAIDVVPGVSTTGEIYVRDMLTGSNQLASAAGRAAVESLMQTTNVVSYNHVVSGDGNYLFYQSSPNTYSATLGTSGLILRYHIQNGTTDIVHTNAFVPRNRHEEINNLSVTPDGRFVAFVANTNGVYGTNTCILVWDGNSGDLTLVSGDLTNGVPVSVTSAWPTIDPTGRYVAFLHNEGALTTNSVAGRHNIYIRDLQLNSTTLVNVDSNGIASPVGAMAAPSMDDSGRFVIFEAPDGTLAAGDRNNVEDVFVRDVVAGTTELISKHHPNLGSLSPNGRSLLSDFCASGTGRIVAFTSDADNIVDGDTNATWDVFVRDVVSGLTRLVSVGTNGVSGNKASTQPAISSDGRYVTFTSLADNLVPNDTNTFGDVFLWDAEVGTNALISTRLNTTFSGNGGSHTPVIAGNGRFIVFRSAARDIASGSFDTAVEHLYVKDLESGTATALTTRGLTNFSAQPAGQYVAFIGRINFNSTALYVWDLIGSRFVYTNSNFSVLTASISADGRYVTFETSTELYAVDLLLKTNSMVASLKSPYRASVQFSADSQFLTFVSATAQTPNDTNGVKDVYLYNLKSKEKLLVSRATNSTAGNAISERPCISFDGRFVIYRSYASNIVGTLQGQGANLYSYDRVTDSNMLFPMNRYADDFGDSWSFPAVMSGDGRTIVFSSRASDLTSQDFNRRDDVFSYSLLGLNVVRAGAEVTITWPAATHGNYQVQFKNNLNDSQWQNLDIPIVVAGGSAVASYILPDLSHRFYRVIAK